ncbi:MAG: hypothetical protein L0Y72_07950 [Gemmataceae bacterium]|nr:hypothetical protein [Gemmataceae bacterium]MCI0738962.1 hypothetical protein [Gemmataceae bacterium]
MGKSIAAVSLTLTCLCLTLGQAPNHAPSDIMHTNQRQLRIPINFQDARRAEMRELMLFASSDQGRNWQQVAAVAPDKTDFTFFAPADGAYWLRVAVINRQGKQEPENLQQGPPDLKILIDTVKPTLRLGAPQRHGDDVTLAWEIQETHPDWQNFRLDYVTKDAPSSFGTAIAATPGLTGQARFKASAPGPLVVRLSVRDQAGNQATATAEVPGSIGVSAASPNPMHYNASPIGQTPSIAPPPIASSQVSEIPPPAPPVIAKQGALPPALPFESSNGKVPPPVGNGWTPPAQGAVDPNVRLVADSGANPPSTPPIAPVSKKPLPTVQYVNQTEVTLEYELAKVGPSGVGSVDLWWTQNDGHSWERFAEDPEIKGTTKSGRHKRTLDLPGDGLYGFALVVKSAAGLGKAPPRAGDAPEIRIEVDTSQPVAQLFSPTPDPDRPNALLLKWAVRDNNLTVTPITLEWAERREGPWNVIVANAGNTQKHSWQLPEKLPVQVFLRLRARDAAGNEGVAVTTEPQLVDLSEPEGRLVNVFVTPKR